MDKKEKVDIAWSIGEKAKKVVVKEILKNYEQQERGEELENPGALENDDFSSILTSDAQKAVQGSEGPLKYDELLMHLMSDNYGKKKEAMAVVRKYPNRLDDVINQFSHFHDNFEEYRNERKALDVPVIQKTRKMIESLKKIREPNSNKKKKLKNTADKKPPTAGNKRKSPKTDVAGKSNIGKFEMPVKQEKGDRKRKLEIYNDEDDDSASSQDTEVEHVTRNFSKRCKLSSPRSSQERESGMFRNHRQPRPVIDSESSQSSSEENQSSQERGQSRSKRNAPECNGNEETVDEKYFPLRGRKQNK